MRILTKKEMLKQPPGTIFSVYSPCVFHGFYVKDVSYTDIPDFLEAKLIGNPDCKDSDDFLNKCTAMEKGESVDIDCHSYGREGLFDDSMMYAVYEKADTEKIIEVLKKNPL